MKRIVLLLLLFAGCMDMAFAGVEHSDGTTIAEQVQGTDSNSTGFVADVLTWYDAHMNYETVGLLMTLESSFIPFPSEVVTLGALLGAYINYFLSRWLGRPVIYAFAESKVGRMMRLSKEKIQRAETYFNDHGNVSTLVGRLIPVIRQLISIPAGLSKMNLAAFTLFTFVGAGVWNCVLALLGWLAYQAADPSVIKEYSHQLSVIIGVVFAVAVVFLVGRAVIKKRKSNG